MAACVTGSTTAEYPLVRSRSVDGEVSHPISVLLKDVVIIVSCMTESTTVMLSGVSSAADNEQ